MNLALICGFTMECNVLLQLQETLLVSTLKQQNGKNIWIIGGAEIIEELLKENLIDEYIISVIPTILGEGIPLFKTGVPETKLKLKNLRPLDGVVELTYTKR